jgi:hypothetical protein
MLSPAASDVWATHDPPVERDLVELRIALSRLRALVLLARVVVDEIRGSELRRFADLSR